LKKKVTALLINYLKKFSKIRRFVRKIAFLNQVFIEKDQIKIEIIQLNSERAKYKNLVRSLLKQKERPVENEILLSSKNFKSNYKPIRLKRTRTASFFEYFERASKIKHGIMILPLIGQIFREKYQLEAEKKDLQIEIEKYKTWVQFLLKWKKKDIRHNIATIIQYSTNDYKFLKYCINETKKFSKQVIVTVSDHFFDGTPEDRGKLEKSYEENEDIIFVEFKYDHHKPIPFIRYWFCYSKLMGLSKLEDNIEYILFLDTDEIIEGDRFLDWLNHFNYKDYNAIELASYWYFRETKFRALTTQNQGLLVKRKIINEKFIMHPWLRYGMFIITPGKKLSKVVGLDDKPLVHHYSWVRTKEEMLKKVTTWGHRKDKNWIPLVKRELQREFTENSTDFIWGYKYKIVKPYIES